VAKKKRKNGAKLLKSFQFEKGDFKGIAIGVLLPIFMACLVGILVFALSQEWLNVFAIIGVTFLIFVFASLSFVIWRGLHPASLSVYEDGIEYQIGESYIFSTWDNINAFELRQEEVGSRGSSYFVPLPFLILFREAETISEPSFSDKWAFRRHSKYHIPLYQVLRIPLIRSKEIDYKSLRTTEFGQYLLEYAPHIFEEANHETQKN
jgi:hypothetical protein